MTLTGREKIEAAFSPEGSPEIAAVICYEDVYYRDHWAQLTSAPWWDVHSPDLGRQLAWYRDAIEKTGQDWLNLPSFYPRDVRRRLAIEQREDGIYLIDRLAGSARLLSPLPSTPQSSRSAAPATWLPRSWANTARACTL